MSLSLISHLNSRYLQIPEDTLQTLSNAVKDEKFPILCHLSLSCVYRQKLELLFQVKWSVLSSLDVNDSLETKLLLYPNESKMPKLRHLSAGPLSSDDSVEHSLTKPLSNLRSLKLFSECQNGVFEKIVKNGTFLNLSELTLVSPQVSLANVLDSIQLPSLKKLSIHEHRLSKEILEEK